MPNRQGRAWCDKGATEWRKVYDREGAASPDNVTIELNGENELSVKDSVLDAKEDVANKVTSVSSSSTDTEYASAKAVYTAVENVPVPDISGKEDKSNKVTSVSSSSTDTEYASAKALYTEVNARERKLTAGDGISIDRTDENEPIISAFGGGGLPVPLEVDYESELPDISGGSAEVQYFIIANMDESMPNRQGRAWCDKGATEWRKVYDREGAASPDNVTIELNDLNQLKVADFTVEHIDENRDKFTEGETYSMKALLQSVVNKIDGLIETPPVPPVPPVPPGYDDDIVFVINTGSTVNFSIPTSGAKGGESAEYNWTVYIDDEEKGTYTGASTPSTTSGIAFTSTSGVDHTIRLKPADGNHYVGWGCAFGFYKTTGDSTNKAKFVEVLQDPDWAHLYKENDTGHDFKYHQFYDCYNLRYIAPETLPPTVTKIGNNFRAYQYWNSNTSVVLTKATAEYIPDSVISIGNNFRAYQYYNRFKLLTTVDECLPDSVTEIGSGFRMYQYACSGSGAKPVFLAGNHTHSKQFAELLNASDDNYKAMFSSPANTTVDYMPVYYLEDGVTTQPVTALTPDKNKGYVYNRTGIEGYSSLNANWKGSV
jgi:hypothetical protein